MNSGERLSDATRVLQEARDDFDETWKAFKLAVSMMVDKYDRTPLAFHDRVLNKQKVVEAARDEYDAARYAYRQELLDDIRPFVFSIYSARISPTADNIAVDSKPRRTDQRNVSIEFRMHLLNSEDFEWRFPLILRLLYALHSRLPHKGGGAKYAF